TGVARDGMVLVVAQHHLPKPDTDFGRAMMLPALKLGPNGFELGNHPLFRRDPPDDEWSGGKLPTEMGEAQKREGFRFPFATPTPISSSKPPEFDQSCLIRMQFQTELSQPFSKCFQKPFSFRPVLKAHH